MTVEVLYIYLFLQVSKSYLLSVIKTFGPHVIRRYFFADMGITTLILSDVSFLNLWLGNFNSTCPHNFSNRYNYSYIDMYIIS